VKAFGVIAHGLGAVPLAWLALLAVRGYRVDAAWWWMAVAFGVSFAADVASLVVGHPLVSQTYPVLQGAVFTLALVPSRYAVRVIAAFFVAAAVSVTIRHAAGLDVLLHVVSWGFVAAFAVNRVPALAWGFAALCVAWLAYVAWPGWWTWGAMQAVRGVTACAWGVSAWREARR
jgi:hypothetical protein